MLNLLAKKVFKPSSSFRCRGTGFGGFTLIELLIVVAIIGILASVVLVSQKGSRSKGADAAVRAGLQQIIAQSENYYDTEDAENSYDGACDSDIVSKQTEEINRRVAKGTSVSCYSDDQAIAVSAELKGGDTWCVDNNSGGGFGMVANESGECEEN